MLELFGWTSHAVKGTVSHQPNLILSEIHFEQLQVTLLFHCPKVPHLLHRTLKVCLVEEFESLCIRLLLVLSGNIVLYSLHEIIQ